MEYRRTIFCSTSFVAIHHWHGAQPPVEYLRDKHRHLFKVQVRAVVQHNDRDIEFITLKEMVERHCFEQWHGRDIGQMSCEAIAQEILEAFPELESCTVSEDGENGATLARV